MNRIQLTTSETPEESQVGEHLKAVRQVVASLNEAPVCQMRSVGSHSTSLDCGEKQ